LIAAPVLDKAVLTEAIKESIAPLKTSIDAIDARIKAIETMPAYKAFNINAGVTTENYRGYKLADQGERLREKFATRPNWFRTLSNADKFTEFCKFMLDVKDALLGDVTAQIKLQEAARAAKASNLVEGTAGLGGYLVPVEYQMDLIKLAREVSFALQKCTVIPMSALQMHLPAEATLVTAYWAAEGSAPTASNPTFGQVTLTAKKLGCLTAGISMELLADSAVDIVSMITEQMMYAQGLELDNQVLNGTGSPWSGVFAAAGYSVVLATGSTAFSSIGTNNVRDMIRKLSAIDSANAEFIYSKDIQYYIDVLKDTTGRYIYRDPSGDRPAALWNRPVFESTQAPAESASAVSTAFAALGVWKYFYLGRRMGDMAFSADPYTNFTTDLIVFKAITRWAGAVARSTAFCKAVTAGA
jgi:HK97 family phage major capsid protein